MRCIAVNRSWSAPFEPGPDPRVWTVVYPILELGHIWPYNVASASVAVAAIVLGHLPRADDSTFVHVLSCGLFLLAFMPLIFGGTVYKTLERIMTAKLVVVLIFFCFVATFLISARSMREVASGFIHFGQIPLRAHTIVAGRHFTLYEQDGSDSYRVQGTFEEAGTVVTEFRVGEVVYKIDDEVPAQYGSRREQMVARAKKLSRPGRFFVEQRESQVTLTAEGAIDIQDGSWRLERVALTDEAGPADLRAARRYTGESIAREGGGTDTESGPASSSTDRLRARKRTAARPGLGNDCRVRLDRRRRWADERAFVQLRPRQGMGHGSQRGRDRQRRGRYDRHPFARRPGVSPYREKYDPLAGLDATHRQRPGSRLR